MSGQATGWVLRHGPGRSDRAAHAVLITIADAANRDGEHAHPGIQAIIDGSGYSRSTVFASLDRLLTDRYIEVEEEGGGRGRATVYRIPGVTDLGWRPGPEETVQSSDLSEEANGPETVQSGTVNSPETVQISGSTPHTQPATVSTNGNGAPSGAPLRATRCPEPFLVSIEMRDWAAENTPQVDVHDQTHRFVDYWRAKSGRDATKLDWAGTWRNWMRRAQDDVQRRPGRRGRPDTLEQFGDLRFDDSGNLVVEGS